MEGNVIKEIELTRGMFAIVDDDDYERLSELAWHVHEKHGIFYARNTCQVKSEDGSKAYKSTLMHRLILDAPRELFVDHINGNGLDNRKSNLRLCTNTQNTHNAKPRHSGTSKYKGVYWNARDKRWIATITREGKRKCLGCFHDEKEAALAYDEAAILMHGKFARLNFSTKEAV